MTPAASPFVDPTSLSGLKIWLDANDLTTLFQDSALTTPVTTNGNPVGGWTDKSGNGNNVTQATAGSRPKWWNSGPPAGTLPNGKPVLFFDQGGTTSFLDSAALNYATATLLFVLQDIHTTDGTFFDKAAAGTGRITGYRESNGALTLYAGSSVTSAANLATYSATVLSFLVNGASSGTWRDGASLASGDIGSNALGSLRVGAGGTGFAGSISEVVVYNRALTTTERQQVEAFLKAKWATP